MLGLRNSLLRNEIEEKSGSIKSRLFSFGQFVKAETVLFYMSFGSEVQTHEMVKESLKSKRVAVPVTDKENRALIISEISGIEEMPRNVLGMPEPKKESMKPINTEGLDIVIVPGIAFDTKGNRIGYGHGYYDNFLKRLSAPKIALAYELQIVDNIPAAENDVCVDFIVTEKRVIKCCSA